MTDDSRDERQDRLAARFNESDGEVEDDDDNDSNDVNDVVEQNDAVEISDSTNATDAVDDNDVVEDNDMHDTTDTVDANDAEDEQTVRNTTGRTFYVGEETLAELDDLYKRLEFQYYQEHGDDLPKNKAFYPALFEVIVENPDLVAEKLGLELE